MAENARIAEKWLFAAKGMNVCTAHTDAMDAYKRLTSSWCLGKVCGGEKQLARFGEQNGFHQAETRIILE